MTSISERISEIENEIEQLVGAPFDTSRTRQSVSLFTFKENLAEFERFIAHFTDHSIIREIQPARRKKVWVMKHVIRLLHNFTASSFTLVEHTRKYARLLFAESPTLGIYQEKKDEEFANDPFSRFVIGLRNFLQHRHSPLISLQVSLTDDEKQFTALFLLLLDDLKSSRKWDSLAQEYVDELVEDVNVLDIVHDYGKKVLDFHAWFQELQREGIADRYELVEELRDELILLRIEESIEVSLEEFKTSYPMNPDHIFELIFTDKELAALSKFAPDDPARPEKAISFIREMQEMPEELANKIKRWYSEKGSKVIQGMRLITDRDEISKAQELFARSISSRSSSSISVSIGYQSGQYDTKVYWIPDLGYWAYFGFPPSEKSAGTHYWNVFGHGKPSGMVSVVCEINPPVQGVNRQAAGAFVMDASGYIHLIHRGIFNSRGRIKKDFIFRTFDGRIVNINDAGRCSKVIYIGRLKDENLPELIRAFILEANRIKDLVRANRGG
jgi:hypothetical protein